MEHCESPHFYKYLFKADEDTVKSIQQEDNL